MATRAAAKTAAKPATLTRRDFFSDVLEAVRRGLPAERQQFESRQTMNLLKISYGANYRSSDLPTAQDALKANATYKEGVI